MGLKISMGDGKSLRSQNCTRHFASVYPLYLCLLFLMFLRKGDQITNGTVSRDPLNLVYIKHHSNDALIASMSQKSHFTDILSL